ncbi:MAG: hypothetical protein CMP23_14335 [Rickettsiales bacterium]|nr:hypothetical protein [Rickettsiales bacterium]|tara:strand:- start:1252 stop:3381 length:2130 start_codon:yes stop_codon:yes gene_type:complete
MRSIACLSFLSVFAVLTWGCGSEVDPTAGTTYTSSTRIEFQDIYVPDRLIEVGLLPAGTEVVSEVFVHNAGDRALFVEEVSLNHQSDPNWSILPESIPSTIEPHEHAVIEVLYVASDSQDTFAAMEIFSDDPDEAEKSVAFIGRQASGGPEARVSANIVDWGFQFLGVESRRSLELRNLGDADLYITAVELIQSESQPAFSITCPGASMGDCDWHSEVEDVLLATPIVPGSAAFFDLSFAPLNLQAVSAQLNIQTSDPVRPEFTVFLLGNGESAINCTPPSVEVVSPVEASFYHQWQELELTVRVFDQEQPPDSLYVELFLGGLLIENGFPDENGFVTFAIDIDDHSPPIPTGLQPLSIRVTDGCQLWGFDSFVAAVDFPLSAQDVDGDGFDPNQGDCDENNAGVFPQAVEAMDGYDNNCNGIIDEQTVVWDDDCDGYCEHDTICLGQGPAVGGAVCSGLAAAPFGDCNDSSVDRDNDGLPDGFSIHPEAAEGLNFIDDNCNGTTDEGTTFFDDDGDGQTEAVGDCDDESAGVFLGAVEWCDELDNDCDGTIDNDCLDQWAPPRIIGGVLTDRFQVELGSRLRAEVLVISSDENLTYEWQTDMDGFFDEPANGPSVFWNAPADTDENRAAYLQRFPSIMVTVTDSRGQSASGFGNVLLSQDVTTAYNPVVATSGEGQNCSFAAGGTASAPAVLLALLGLLGGLRARRLS